MKQKFLLGAVALCLAIGLTSCGGEKQEEMTKMIGNSPGNNTGLVYAVDHFPSIGFTTHFYLSYKGTRLLQ